MISWSDVYHVLSATVPLYVAMLLAYISVKRLKLFRPDQCSGINKFVAKIAIPLLSFKVISRTDPYHMSLKLIIADTIQKLSSLIALAIVGKLSSKGNLGWVITSFSLATLPNTLIVGIPLLKGMYGEEAAILLSQIVGLQSIIWYNLLLFLYEFRAAEGVSANSPLEEREELEDPPEVQSKEGHNKSKATTVTKTKTILLTVGKKLIWNPNTHATLLGLIWAIISFRWNIKLPEIIEKSISILSDGGLGMAMFSLGLFMASQTSIIACGTRLAALAVGTRFLIGPAIMAVSSLAIESRGKLLKILIVQAALPQGIVPFVFAKEYNLHPSILSTAVILGLLIALPIALAYYFLLEL
ncbi:hypothetical protein MKW98_017784 [Papaver atlanticum]|uniref:Auxin efflux carrier component n=1 Tax=Papaver atlanticum TaxID=357466 RepID=A0AAD4XV63_9MAGN|nr:hypothetical protein MKW98_017784 [Papaver atlanticum]